MNDDDDDSCCKPNKKIKIGVLFLALFLGYTISDTYFILVVVKRTGENLLSFYNAAGALLSLIVSYAILKFTHKFESVNKKLIFGSLLYMSFEIILYGFTKNVVPASFALFLFIIDNMALVAYSAPAETYAIKYMNDVSSVIVGAFENRIYIVAEILGAGIAYSLYPNFGLIFGASLLAKALVVVLSIIYPSVSNHDEFSFKKAISFENIHQIVPLTAAEVYYLTIPVIVATFWGERNFGVYEMIMEAVVFITIPYAAKMIEKNWKYALSYLVMIPIILWNPLVGLVFYYVMTSSIQLNMRDDVIEDQGVDDGIITTGVQKVFAAMLAFPVIYVFGATTMALIILLILTIGIFVFGNISVIGEVKDTKNETMVK